jgi:cyclohexanecarboxyl-CoA dehydrogenase
LTAPGVTISELDDMGNRGLGRAIVTYQDVRVPAWHQIGSAGAGLRNVMERFTYQKVVSGLQCIGAATASLHDAMAWAQDRITWGKPLSARQGIAFPLVTGAAEIEMARLFCYKALWQFDEGLSWRREAAMAKALIPRKMMEICHEALLVLGHTGYSHEHPVQLRLRDVMAAELAEGPEHIQKILLTRDLLGAIPS